MGGTDYPVSPSHRGKSPVQRQGHAVHYFRGIQVNGRLITSGTESSSRSLYGMGSPGRAKKGPYKLIRRSGLKFMQKKSV